MSQSHRVLGGPGPRTPTREVIPRTPSPRRAKSPFAVRSEPRLNQLLAEHQQALHRLKVTKAEKEHAERQVHALGELVETARVEFLHLEEGLASAEKECREQRVLKETAFDECHQLQLQLDMSEQLALEGSPMQVDLEARVEQLRMCNQQLESAMHYQTKKYHKQSARAMIAMRSWMIEDPRAAEAVADTLAREALGEADFEFELEALQCLFHQHQHRIPDSSAAGLEEQLLLDQLPGAVLNAPELHDLDRNQIEAHCGRAVRKFTSFDADENGWLEVHDLKQVATWVWSTFEAHGSPLSDLLVEAEVHKMLSRVHQDLSGRMSQHEFVSYFKRTAQAITRFRKAQHSSPHKQPRPELLIAQEGQLMQQLPVSLLDSAPELTPEELDAVEDCTARAYKEFQALDPTGNGVVGGDDLMQLSRWVLQSFSSEGQQPTEEQVSAEAAKLLHRLHSSSSAIELTEFVSTYNRAATQIARFRKGQRLKATQQTEQSDDGGGVLVEDGELREAFNEMDITRDGQIDVGTLQQMLPAVAAKYGFDSVVDMGKIATLFKYFDSDGSSTLDFLEFSSLIRGVSH